MVTLPPMADTPAAAAERAVIIAQAKILVERLAAYTQLIGDWALEGWDDDGSNTGTAGEESESGGGAGGTEEDERVPPRSDGAARHRREPDEQDA